MNQPVLADISDVPSIDLETTAPPSDADNRMENPMAAGSMGTQSSDSTEGNPLAFMDSWADGESDYERSTGSDYRGSDPDVISVDSRRAHAGVSRQNRQTPTKRRGDQLKSSLPASGKPVSPVSSRWSGRRDPYEPTPNRRHRRRGSKPDVPPAIRPMGAIKLGVALVVIAVIAYNAPAILSKMGVAAAGAANSVAGWSSMLAAGLGGVTIPWAIALQLAHAASSLVRKLAGLAAVVLAVVALWFVSGKYYESSCRQPTDGNAQYCSVLSRLHGQRMVTVD